MIVLAVVVWAWGWGWFSHKASPTEIIVSAFWPILWPTGFAYHWWVWGTLWGDVGRRRHVYTDRRWWQRGDREPRPSDWMAARG